MRANALRNSAVEYAAPFERPDASYAQYAFQWPFISASGRTYTLRPRCEIAWFKASRNPSPEPFAICAGVIDVALIPNIGLGPIIPKSWSKLPIPQPAIRRRDVVSWPVSEWNRAGSPST